MKWIDFNEKFRLKPDRYLVVIQGPSYEFVDIAYFNGGYFKLENKADKVIKYMPLPEVE